MFLRRFLLGVAVILALPSWSCGEHRADREPRHTSPSAAFEAPVPDPKVVIFVIDGARYSETFGDSTHANIPRIWNDLRPQGTIITDFRNMGITTTVPGHTSILTGTWQNIANDGTERPTQPTLFEYYRQATGAPQSDAYVVSGKSKLYVCSYSTSPSYGAAYSATEDAGYTGDVTVYTELISVLQNEKPRVVLAALPDVDLRGHGGVWSEYLGAIVGADSLADKTWSYLQSDPFYAGQTYMFITNDHGRHDDAHGGFQNHGDGCDGCRHLMFLALGPEVQAGHSVPYRYTQPDICTTAAQILGIAAPYSNGNFMQDIFQSIATGIE